MLKLLKVFKKCSVKTYEHAEIHCISCVIWNCFPKSNLPIAKFDEFLQHFTTQYFLLAALYMKADVVY